MTGKILLFPDPLRFGHLFSALLVCLYCKLQLTLPLLHLLLTLLSSTAHLADLQEDRVPPSYKYFLLNQNTNSLTMKMYNGVAAF